MPFSPPHPSGPQACADTQEALSLRYAPDTYRLRRLTSGRFAWYNAAFEFLGTTSSLEEGDPLLVPVERHVEQYFARGGQVLRPDLKDLDLELDLDLGLDLFPEHPLSGER